MSEHALEVHKPTEDKPSPQGISQESTDVVAREGNAAVGVAISFGVIFFSALLWVTWQALIPLLVPLALTFGPIGVRVLHGLRWLLPCLVYVPPVFAFLQVRQKAPLAFGSYSRITALVYGLATPIIFLYLW